jgi:DNA-binding NarL/FixJ family response regulator
MRRLLIVDEHPVVLGGIQSILDQAGVAVELEGAAMAAEAIARLRTSDWSAVVVDMALSEGGGTGFLGRLYREHPELPILIFTALPETPYGLRALRAGASGFLHKTAAPEVLVEAVRRTLGGRRYVSPSLAEQLADRMVNDSDAAVHELLSDREFEVFRLIALGKSMTEIGDALSISPKTAHAHRANILRKTGLADNQALTSYAFEQKLIPGRRAEDRRVPRLPDLPAEPDAD